MLLQRLPVQFPGQLLREAGHLGVGLGICVEGLRVEDGLDDELVLRPPRKIAPVQNTENDEQGAFAEQRGTVASDRSRGRRSTGHRDDSGGLTSIEEGVNCSDAAPASRGEHLGGIKVIITSLAGNANSSKVFLAGPGGPSRGESQYS